MVGGKAIYYIFWSPERCKIGENFISAHFQLQISWNSWNPHATCLTEVINGARLCLARVINVARLSLTEMINGAPLCLNELLITSVRPNLAPLITSVRLNLAPLITSVRYVARGFQLFQFIWSWKWAETKFSPILQCSGDQNLRYIDFPPTTVGSL